MPIYNEFLTTTEMFAIALDEDVGREISRDFRKFLFPLFYPHDDMSTTDSSNPINAYGALGDSSGNRNRLRNALDNVLPSDHEFHVLMERLFDSSPGSSSDDVRSRFNAMIRKYRDYSISVRDDSDSE